MTNPNPKPLAVPSAARAAVLRLLRRWYPQYQTEAEQMDALRRQEPRTKDQQ